MGYALAPNVHACAADGIVYFLDVEGDRYCKAGPAASQAIIAADLDIEARTLLEPLAAAGLLTEQVGTSHNLPLCMHPLPSADIHASLGSRPPARVADAVEVAALAVRAAWRLRVRGFASALGDVAADCPKVEARPADLEGLAGQIARYQCARALLPTSPRCLLDSLILKRWAMRRGIAARLVIGVRPLPFAAHCWVEHDAVVLNGSQDGIANFVPILIL